MATNTTPRALGPADEALIAAEREIAELKQKQAALHAAGDDSDHDEISGRVSDLETLICNIPPNSLTGAVVKLRQLVDDLDASTPCEGDEQSVRQILAIVERAIEPGDHPPPQTGGDRPEREQASIIELVEKRFRLSAEGDRATRGLGHDDETINSVVDAMDAATGALDQAIVDRIPETPDEICAQLRLYHERVDHDDERDERLFKSMMAGLAGLGGIAAKGGAATCGDSIAAQIVREAEDKLRQQRVAWDNLFAEWLTNRAEYMGDKIDWSQRDEGAHGERMDELARLITTTPAVLPWMILRKIEVLEYYLGADNGTGWRDNREITMLAGIKADLLRFEPSDGDAA